LFARNVAVVTNIVDQTQNLAGHIASAR